MPGAGDDVYFNSSAMYDFASGHSRDCNNLTSAAGSFASVHIQTGYTGTVSLGAALTLGTFELASGAISQPIAGSDLAVTTDFTWTGGTLNSSNNGANLFVTGTGTIAPASAGTVTTNDTLQFIGAENAPSSTTVFPGTVVFGAVGGGMIIGGFATLTAKTTTSGDIIGITKNQAGASQITILENGTLGCIGPGTASYDLPLVNRGTFNLTGSVRVNLTSPTVPVNADYLQDGNAQLRIENGSVLTTADGVNIAGGVVALLMNANLPANQQTATINGKFSMSSGTIIFAPPLIIGTDLVYGTFTVNGDVNWTGGTYKPSVDYTAAGLANTWIVNGTLTSAAACIIQPNNQRGQNPPANSVWVVLNAAATAGALPTVGKDNNTNQLALGSFTVELNRFAVEVVGRYWCRDQVVCHGSVHRFRLAHFVGVGIRPSPGRRGGDQHSSEAGS